MQTRTYIGILVAVAVVVYASFLTPLNFELLVEQQFLLNSDTSIPVWAALLTVFLAGLVPGAALLAIRSLQRDLSRRRKRRQHREVESVEQRYRRAVDFHVDGQWRKAAAELEVLLTDRPEDFPTLLLYGEVLRRQGETRQALEIHRRASVLYPRSVALLYQLAEDYEAVGEPQVAREIRSRIQRDFPGQGLKVMFRRRDLAMAAGNWAGAVRWHDKILALLEEIGDTQGLEHEQGVSHGLTYQRGVELLEKDRPADAARIFKKLLGQESRFIPAWIMLGEAALLQDDQEGALAEWRRGYQETASPVFLKRIEDHFIEAEAPARAIETLREIIAAADSDLFPRFFLGRLYYRLEMHDEALKVLVGLGERLDPSPTYHYLMGRIRQRRDDPRGAMSRYLECLKRLGVTNANFVCRSCNAGYPEWRDRCETCGSWNSVDVDLQEERLTAEEVGLAERPVWGGYSRDDTRVPETSNGS